MKKHTMVTAAALLLMVLAAGCRNAQSDTNTTTSADTSVFTQTETTQTATQDFLQENPTEETQEITTPTGTEEVSGTTENVHIQESVGAWEDPTQGTEKEEKPDKIEPKPTRPSQPVQNTEPTNTEDEAPELLTYEQYIALTPKEKQAYFESFATVEAFYEWLEVAEEAYNEGENTATGDAIIIIPGK